MFQQILLFTTTSWFLASLLAVLFFIAWLKFFFFAKSQVSPSRPPMSWRHFFSFDRTFLLLFLVFFLCSFFFRLQPYGYNEFIAFTVGPLSYLLCSRIPLKNWIIKHCHVFSWVLTVGSGLMSLYALIVFLFQHISRLSGIFRGVESYVTYPNTFAMFLLMVLPFHAYLFVELQKTSLWKKLTNVFFWILNFMAFVLTFSRGAYLSFFGMSLIFVGGIIFLKWHEKFRSKIFWYKIIQGALIFLLAFLLAVFWNEWHRSFQPAELAKQVPLTENIVTRVADQDRSADQSSNERVEFWKGAVELIKQYPWFGIGSDGFRFQYPRVQNELLATSTHPHNLFLKLGVENGLPAAFFMLLFLLLLAWSAARDLFKMKLSSMTSASGFHLAVFMCFVAMNLHLMVDYNINATFVWAFYWLVIILMRPSADFPEKITSRPLFILEIFLGGATIGILLLSILTFWQYRQFKDFDLRMSVENALFQPLVYEKIGEVALDGKLDLHSLNDGLLLLQSAEEKYPLWAELKIAMGRVYFSKKEFDSAVAFYSQALLLNSLDNLDWHFEYLQALRSAGMNETIRARENFYYTLLKEYTAKLQNNEHNTLATQNQKSAYEMMKFYIASVPQSTDVRWADLKKEYEQIWEKERDKFQKIYPEMASQILSLPPSL